MHDVAHDVASSLTAEQYLEAIRAADPLEHDHVRCLVDTRCRENRRWLREQWPERRVSYRLYEAVALPLAAFADDPELVAQLRSPDSLLVIEAAGKFTVERVPVN